MKILVQFRSFINVVWGTNIQNREAFAYMRGFPATFFLTERRAIVVGEFLEKEGWLKKKKQFPNVKKPYNVNWNGLEWHQKVVMPNQRLVYQITIS